MIRNHGTHDSAKLELSFSIGKDLTTTGDIIVVDDDPEIREVVIRYLGQNGVRVRAASTRRHLNHHLSMTNPSLILLDLRLGREEGLDILREIRAQSDVPIIIMTGRSLEEADRIVGLELGADDYILKPFDLRVLLARIRALLRRQEIGRLARARQPELDGYKFGGWRLDLQTRSLLDPKGAQVSLGKSEYALLVAFLQSPGRALTREYLVQATRLHEDILDRSIDGQVLRLRRKLEAHPEEPTMIKTEKGIGYVFAQAVERY